MRSAQPTQAREAICVLGIRSTFVSILGVEYAFWWDREAI